MEGFGEERGRGNDLLKDMKKSNERGDQKLKINVEGSSRLKPRRKKAEEKIMNFHLLAKCFHISIRVECCVGLEIYFLHSTIFLNVFFLIFMNIDGNSRSLEYMQEIETQAEMN